MSNPSHESNGQPILVIRKLNKRFGGVDAVVDFSFSMQKGELKGLIGPNGAGKTTIFNLISGYLKPDSGVILFKENNITRESPDRRVNRGIARTFQNIRIEKQVRVIDQMKTAFFRHMKYGISDVLFHTNRYNQEEVKIAQESLEILDFLGIAHLQDRIGEDIPHGQQMKLSIARAMALKPELLLLDEPTAGLNTAETSELVRIVLQMKEKHNLSILLIEHDMNVIMEVCEDIVAINEGRIIGTGTPNEIQNNQRVVEAYLGGVA
jgi:branched-chain amino acid transport system ATP-binding protein